MRINAVDTDACLILFTRYPEPGTTKTRLIPRLGAVRAAQLQRQMTEHMVREIGSIRARISLEIHFSGGCLDRMKNWLGRHLTYRSQSPGGLGQSLHQAFSRQFESGKTGVVVIGSDCPDISAAHLEEAFRRLQTHDVVLGPAEDGGYYLIGLRQAQAELFKGISWGTAAVFEQTREIATRLNLSIATLEQLSDVDRPEDLDRLRGDRLKGLVANPALPV
ncbi:MAG: TIGR04282 family arsenosugar biosynthesis glycosyltransferase [Cyanobacteria bacterium J06628_6]